MTIDTRAYAWCNLGQLSPETPATLADSHIQGSGVVTVRGTVVLLGVVQVAAGTAVDLAYSDGQRWIARVPRRLRVLSSSINPLALGGRGETTLSVGCKLAYMEDRKPPITNPTNTEENSEVPEVERRVATPPLTAAFVVGKILTALGLTAANTIPMTIRRIVDEWDLSAGYVEELGRIVSSEGYFCRVNEAEQVEFICKNQEQGPGLLVTQQNVIELTPANVGELPGEAVLARYTSLKLVPPDADLSEDEVKKRNWERETVSGDPVQSIHTFTNDAGEQVKQYITYMPVKLFTTSYDQKDRVRTRQESSNELNGLRFSTTSFSYPNWVFPAGSTEAPSFEFGTNPYADESTPSSETTQEFTPVGDYLSACGLEGPHGLFLSGNQCTMMRTTSYDRDPISGVTKTTTRQYTAYINTPFGSDAIAKLREAGEPVSELLKEALKLVPYGSEQRIRTEREYGLQKRPGQAERTALATRKAPSVEQTAEITWAVGSSTSQTVVELSPSYVSDDAIVKVNGVYSVQASNAEAQALNYARIENRLLLANRNGCGIQLTPLHTPPKPFDLLYVRLNGATACFRVNGTTWTIDRDGAVCTIDALFWGAIDGAVADAWFPLPPGASSLPATAAVTTNANPLPANAIAIPNGFNFTNPNLQSLFAALPSGQAPTYAAVINPAQIVRPYHETVELQGGVLVGGSVEVQTWLPTELELDGGVAIGGSVQPIDTLLEVLPAQIVLQPAPITLVSNVGIAAVEVQTAQIVLQPNPINLINLASTTELLLEMEGSGSAFVDSSINNHTVTVVGTVTQSTGLSQWGTKAAEFDGTGGAVVVGGSQFEIVSSEAFSVSFYLSPQTWDSGSGPVIRQVLELVNPDGSGIQIKAEPYNDQSRIYLIEETPGMLATDYRVATVPRDQLCYIKIVRETNGLRRFAVNGIELFNSDTYSGPIIDTNTYNALIVGGTSAEIQAGFGFVGRVDYVKLERIGTTVTEVPIAPDSDITSQAAIRLFPAQLQLQPDQVTLLDEVPINTLEVGTAQLVLQPAPVTLTNTGGSSTAVLLEMEGTGSTFVDTSGNNNAVSVVVTGGQSGVTQTTAQAKWGSKAADFPGTGTAIVVAGTGFPIAAGDPFSVSLYVRPPVSANVRRCLLLMEANSTTWLELSLVPASNQTECYVLLEDYPFSDYRIATIPFNAWSYIKLVREASGLRRFAANGTEIPYVDSYEGEIPVYDSRAYPNGFRVGSTENQIIFNQGIVAHVDHVRLELAATSITAVPTGP
jgi:hypothetical protein